MSNKLHVARIAAFGLVLAGTVIPMTALATNTAPVACSVIAAGTKNTVGTSANDRFSLNGSTVTSKFIVSGDANCRVDVSLATWTAPDGVKGQPYSAQKLYGSANGTFAPGAHSLSTKAPDCYYQFDLIRGKSATAADGSPVYEAGRMMGSAHGGTKVCVTATPSPTPTPVPTHTPAPTPVPIHVPTPTPTPTGSGSALGASTELPKTGGDFSGILGMTSMTVAAVAYIRSRRA